ncbi:hypothetical protein FACS189419_10110 [Planctomycetales bacterium]|nr:hypothetical protein FACS189419_10110 [Planctomycetales bacterium]
MARPRKEVDTSTYTGRFAERLKKLREKSGLTVEELAEKSGVPRTTIYNWESLTRTPSIDDNLLLISEALGVKVRNLLPEK